MNHYELESLESRTLLTAAPGSIDTTFGRHGYAFFDKQTTPDIQTIAAASLPGGKTLLLGVINTQEDAFELARLNTDGTPDTSFGVRGIVTVSGDANYSLRPGALPRSISPNCLAVDESGRIYVGGGRDAEENGFVARLNPDGTPDTTFADHGLFDSRLPSDTFVPTLGAVNTLSVDANGKILLGGDVSIDQNYNPYIDHHNFGVMRLNEDGTPDASFGSRGIAEQRFTKLGRRFNATVLALALDAQGNIVAAGSEGGYTEIVRLKPDGSPDPSFGTAGGIRLIGARKNPLVDQFNTLAIRPSDGEIFAAGGGASILVASFKSNGRPDTAFAHGGTLTVPVGAPESPPGDGNGPQAKATGIEPLPNGQLLVTGDVIARDGSGLLLARLNADGSPDPTFGAALPSLAPSDLNPAGWRFLSVGSRYLYSVGSFGLLPGDRGTFVIPVSNGMRQATRHQLMAFRFRADGSFDNTFGYLGAAVAPLPPVSDRAHLSSIAVTPAGGSIVATVTGQADALIAGLSPDGLPDASFHVNQTLPGVRALAVQPDGKVLVHVTRRGGLYLYRFNPDGSLDTTFGSGGFVQFTGSYVASSIQKVLLRPDGSMVVDVLFREPGLYIYGDYKDVLYLLNSSGAIDGSYTVPEINFFSLRSNVPDLTLAPDGSVIVLSGLPVPMPQSRTFLFATRLNATDLSVDTSFGSSGSVQVGPTDYEGSAAVSVAANGDIVMAVVNRLPDGTPASYLARLTPAGALDSTFGANGLVQLPGAGSISAGHMLVQSDRKILLATSDSRGIAHITRLNPDATPDTSFGTGGSVIVRIGAHAVHDDPLIAFENTPGGQKLLVSGVADERPLYPNGSPQGSIPLLLRLNL